MAGKKIAGITIQLSADTAKLTKSLDNVAKKFTAVGTAFTKNVTAPIVAVGGAAIASFKKVDEGYDNIIKKTGATGETLEEFKGIFDDLAGEIPGDMATIGDAIGEVNTRFGITGKELEDLSGQFLKFAQINGQDVTQSVDQTQKALAAYGLGAEEAGHYLDVMNKVAQQTGVSVDSLQSGIISNATAFQEMGLSLEDATVLMGQLEKSGTNSETVLNGMRKALKNATKEGKPLSQALEELEDNILNGTDSMDGLTLAYDLFGKSGDQIYGALKNGTISFKDLANAAIDAGDSVSETFEETLDPVDQFKLAMQKLQIVGAKVGAQLLKVLTPAIEKLSAFIEKLSEKWNSLSPGMKDTIIKIGLVAAAIGPVLLLIGKVISVVSTVIAIGSKLKLVIAALSGPVGIVVAAVAGLVAIGVTLYKNWDTIKAKAEELKNKMVESWNNLKARASESWNNIKNTISNAVEGAKQKAQAAWTNLQNATNQVWTTMKNNIAERGGGIKGVILAAVDGYKQIWQQGFNFINNLTGGKLGEVLGKIRDKATAIKDAIAAPFQKAKDLIQSAWEKIKSFFPISLGKIFTGIKLPHFKISGGEAPWGIGGYGKRPSVSIDWYKKAYSNAMRFTQPTVIPTADGLKGFGDGNGAEWVTGERTLLSLVQKAVSQSSISPELIYQAVKEGAEAAQLSMYVDGRKLTNSVNETNSTIQFGNMRMRGAF